MVGVGVAITRERLERYQVALYLGAALLGLAVGTAAPTTAPALDAALWPVLALLLFVTFVQVPLVRLPSAFREGRFLAALLVGNFVLAPAVVWALSRFLPRDPAILLGALMVLLAPCTDWFITFTQLGRGDARLAIAATPINLLAQIVFLPGYLWLFAGETLAGAVEPARFLGAFLGLILLPLVLAAGTQRWAERRPGCHQWREQLDRMPVPLLAVVVFLIAASQAGTVVHVLHALGTVAMVFVAYLLLAAYLGLTTAKVFRLPPPATRTLIFSLGTRNSFVVLPFALALPAGWDTAAVVIVLQSLVELFGMIGYLWWVPRWLAP